MFKIDTCIFTIKHLITDPEENIEFCLPKIATFPETKSRKIRGKQNSLFTERSVIKWLVI